MVTEETLGQYLLSDPGELMLSGVKNLNYFPLIRTSVYHPIPSGNMAEKNGGKAAETWPRRIDSAEIWRLFQHVAGFKNGFLLFAWIMHL